MGGLTRPCKKDRLLQVRNALTHVELHIFKPISREGDIGIPGVARVCTYHMASSVVGCGSVQTPLDPITRTSVLAAS